MNEDLRYILALLSIRGIGSVRARHLIEAFGSARLLMREDATLIRQAGTLGTTLIEGRRDPRIYDQADHELTFIENHHIRPLIYGAEGFPSRLLECPDAPALLFQLGETDLEARHIVSIVGTRNCTQSGRELTTRFVHELHEAFPDVVIVSGLALGIDVTAHRAALECGARTVGVIAHGLDRIYPTSHREVARQILRAGGSLITEYPSGTNIERGNFLARNRIIAGLSDAIIVAESKDKGGSLVTAAIGNDYGRDIFAFPGRVGDTRSEGCNRLIRLNRAGLITCAQDVIEAMNWTPAHRQPQATQQTIDFDGDTLSAEQRQIVETLQTQGDLRLSQLADSTGIEYTALTEALLDLEMEGRIRCCPGGIYQIR